VSETPRYEFVKAWFVDDAFYPYASIRDTKTGALAMFYQWDNTEFHDEVREDMRQLNEGETWPHDYGWDFPRDGTTAYEIPTT